MSICWLMMVMYDGICSFCSVPIIFRNILGIQYSATDIFFSVKFVLVRKKGLRREKQNHWNGKWTCYSSHLYFSVEKALIGGCAVFWVLAILVLRLGQLVWLASIGIPLLEGHLDFVKINFTICLNETNSNAKYYLVRTSII